MSAFQDDYKVELEVFEGPLDLLLYLIKKNEVDIYDIPIEKITTQYMEYMNLMKMLDLNIAGEFIVMAASLMMIKSRMLLPVEERDEIEEEEEEDPRWDLVRQLVEYKSFKDAAIRLEEMEYRQENIFAQGAGHVHMEADGPGALLGEISIFDLISAFNEVLKNARAEEIAEIVAHHYTVADQIDFVLRTVSIDKPLMFHALFKEESSRGEIICTFLALLELIRLRQILVKQDHQFADIVIEKNPDVDVADVDIGM